MPISTTSRTASRELDALLAAQAALHAHDEERATCFERRNRLADQLRPDQSLEPGSVTPHQLAVAQELGLPAPMPRGEAIELRQLQDRTRVLDDVRPIRAAAVERARGVARTALYTNGAGLRRHRAITEKIADALDALEAVCREEDGLVAEFAEHGIEIPAMSRRWLAEARVGQQNARAFFLLHTRDLGLLEPRATAAR